MLKKIKIWAVIGIFLLSFLAHFIYELFPNLLISIFFPINESIWEHMKIIYTSTIFYGIIDYLLLKHYKIDFNNFKFQLFFTAFISIFIYLIIYLPLYLLFGEHLLVSISLLLLVYIISQIISYKLLIIPDIKILNILSPYFIAITYIIFIYLTFNPPHTFLFYDTVKYKYGFNNYTLPNIEFDINK